MESTAVLLGLLGSKHTETWTAASDSRNAAVMQHEPNASYMKTSVFVFCSTCNP